MEPTPEPTSTCLGPWVPGKVSVHKYVGNNLLEEKVNLENAPVMGGNCKLKHVIPTQNVFRYVVRRALERSMKVNTSKTNMFCVSDSQSFSTDT